MLLPVAPDVFHRIQFGSVGGKILDLDSAVELVDIVAHETAAVGRQAVPDQKQRLANVLHERLQKIDDLRTLDRTGVQPEIEIRNVSPATTDRLFQLKLNSRMGVCPRGAHVRHRCGRWLNPLSSTKMIVRPSLRAFF